LRVLLVTGRLAEPLVRKYAGDVKAEVDVACLPVSVAALITPQMVVEGLRGAVARKKYDMIIVPGLMRGSTKPIEKALGVPVFKGSRYACDIPLVFEKLEELSKEEPLDVIVARERAMLWREIEGYEEGKEARVGFTVGRDGVKGVYVGLDGVVRILAEVVDAPTLPTDRVLSRAEYYLKSGADMIDIGAVVGEDNAQRIAELVYEVRERFKVPVSVDSLNPSEIEAAVEAGADMVLSLDYGNIDEVKIPMDVAVVLLPTNVRTGDLPGDPEGRAEKAFRIVERARGKGFRRIIADLLLEPPINPGFTRSLRSYLIFRDLDRETPLMFGAGNVSEFVDADSVGINAMLAIIAQEVGAPLILTTENSVKTRGSVREVATARRMAAIAKALSSPPKDLGVSLLRAKSKREFFEAPNVEEVEAVFERERKEYTPDPLGYFTIWVNHDTGRIFVLHRGGGGERLFVGGNAEHLGKTILSEGLVGSLEHAVYLGRELGKAECCLKLGKSYVQDADVFGGDYE